MTVEPKDIANRGKKKPRNKREYFRLPERMGIVVQRIERPGANREIERIGPVSTFTTEDISAGGMQFFSTIPYRENSFLEITLNFKTVDPPFDTVTVIARISRVEQIENSQGYNVCVEYYGMSSRDRSHIERYIFLRQREMIAEKRIGFL